MYVLIFQCNQRLTLHTFVTILFFKWYTIGAKRQGTDNFMYTGFLKATERSKFYHFSFKSLPFGFQYRIKVAETSRKCERATYFY